jgi:hypothetical protein
MSIKRSTNFIRCRFYERQVSFNINKWSKNLWRKLNLRKMINRQSIWRLIQLQFYINQYLANSLLHTHSFLLPQYRQSKIHLSDHIGFPPWLIPVTGIEYRPTWTRHTSPCPWPWLLTFPVRSLCLDRSNRNIGTLKTHNASRKRGALFYFWPTNLTGLRRIIPINNTCVDNFDELSNFTKRLVRF